MIKYKSKIIFPPSKIHATKMQKKNIPSTNKEQHQQHQQSPYIT